MIHIDAEGRVQWADATANAGMFWMAPGGGGTCPGIVTKFKAQAYTMDVDLVYKEQCSFGQYQGTSAYDSPFILSSSADHRINLNAFEQALVEKHGLPCRGFYK